MRDYEAAVKNWHSADWSTCYLLAAVCERLDRIIQQGDEAIRQNLDTGNAWMEEQRAWRRADQQDRAKAQASAEFESTKLATQELREAYAEIDRLQSVIRETDTGAPR